MINLNKKFLIYGYGISGKSIERYLNNKNCNYNIYDDFKKITNKKTINKDYLNNNINEYDYFRAPNTWRIFMKNGLDAMLLFSFFRRSVKQGLISEN